MTVRLNRAVMATLAFYVFVATVLIGYAGTLSENDRVTFLHVLSVVQLVVALPVYIWLRIKKTSETGAPPFSFRLPPGKAVTGCLLILGALSLIAYLTHRGETPAPTVERVVWLLVYQVGIIALAEETLFRAIPFTVLPRRALIALVVSSLLFSLYHWNAGPAMLPYFFALGIVFGVLRHFSFPLPMLAILHGAFNIALELFWPIAGFRFGPTAFEWVMPAALICLAALAGWVLSVLDDAEEAR